MLSWFLFRLSLVIAIAFRRVLLRSRNRIYNLKGDFAAVLLFMIFLDPLVFKSAIGLTDIDPVIFGLAFSFSAVILFTVMIAIIKSEQHDDSRKVR